MNTRYVAACIVYSVMEGHSLSEQLDTTLSSIKDERDRAFVQAICYGVCRYYSHLELILQQLLSKPLKEKDKDLEALLLVGLYQLSAMRIPEYAAVTETVNAVAKLKKPWARGLVNGVLREYLRNKTQLEEKLKSHPESYFAHPTWWMTAIKQAWPNWEEILLANNAYPPFSLRVNKQRVSRDEYLAKLNDKYKAMIIPETESGIILEEAMPVENLPGFNAGEISVQDGAAQIAAEILELGPNMHVLDACAAPGGKLTHILEQESQLESVTAVEKDHSRLALIADNLKRLKLTAKCICADVADVDKWWDGQAFDRILLDAPCSASGVIRRHPDIKLLRESSDINPLSKEQFRLLNSLWPLLKPGGLLLYATCSIFPEENAQVLEKFLRENENAQEKIIQANWGIACSIGRQILPGMHHMDGFYYALIKKLL